MDAVDLGVRLHPDVVDQHRCGGTHSGGLLLALLGGARPHVAHRHSQPVRERLGNTRQRRQPEQRDRGRTGLRQGGGPRAPALGDRSGVGAVEPERAAVEGRLPHQIELDGGDDAEGALAATQPEVELAVLGRRHAPQLTVAGDDLEGPDTVAGQAVGPGHRTETAAGGVAHDPDVGDRARERGEAMRRRLLDHAEPLHTGADARPSLGVHDAFVETPRRHQDVADQRADRAMAGGLRGHGEPVPPGEADRLDDVLRTHSLDRDLRLHRDRELPGRHGAGIRRVGRRGHRSDHPGAQLGHRGKGRWSRVGSGEEGRPGRVGDGHDASLSGQGSVKRPAGRSAGWAGEGGPTGVGLTSERGEGRPAVRRGRRSPGARAPRGWSGDGRRGRGRSRPRR